MRQYVRAAAIAASLMTGATAHAATITFSSDPFEGAAGAAALATPGRQIVGSERFVSFTIGTDTFEFDPAVFGIESQIHFVNDVAVNVPASGANVIVLRDFDDDANLGTPFLAGNAADLIATQVTTSGAGFFMYFNSILNLTRLVYSTNLSDNQADLKILARFTNLTGPSGRDALSTITAENFDTKPVPEPSSLLMLASGAVALAGRFYRRRT